MLEKIKSNRIIICRMCAIFIISAAVGVVWTFTARTKHTPFISATPVYHEYFSATPHVGVRHNDGRDILQLDEGVRAIIDIAIGRSSGASIHLQ